MTKLLEEAFSKASQLSSEEQDALADWLLRELESESRWEKQFLNPKKSLVILQRTLLPNTEEVRMRNLIQIGYEILDDQRFPGLSAEATSAGSTASQGRV